MSPDAAEEAILQERIDALPGEEELSGMNEEEKASVYGEISAIYDELSKLTEEEASALNTDKLETSAQFFTQGIMLMTIDADDVCAIGDTGYATLAAAVAAAEEGDTITLQKGVTESITIPAGKNIMLAMNGQTLTNEEEKDTIVNEGTLTVTGEGTLENTSGSHSVLVNRGTANLNGGSFTKGNTSYYTVVNEGIMTVDGASVSNESSNASCIENGWNEPEDIPEGKNAVLTVISGTLSGGLNTVKNDAGGILEIKGGTITNNTQYAIMNWNKAEISGGEITCTAVRGTNKVYPAAVFNMAYEEDPENSIGELVISGGKLTTTQNLTYALDNRSQATISGTAELIGGSSAVQTKGTGSKTIVTGGTLTGQIYYGITISDGSKVEISGGNIVGGTKSSSCAVRTSTNADVLITGGNFSNQVGAAQDTIYVASTAKVKIQGGEFSGGSRSAVYNSMGKLNITGGNFTNAGNVIYVRKQKSAVTTISGGTFTSTDNKEVLIKEDENTGTLEVAGGTYSGDVSRYVIEGNKAILGADGKYYIGVDESEAVAEIDGYGYATLQAAIDAAEAGDTVKLLKSTSENIVIPEDGDLTLELSEETTLTNHTENNETEHTITNYGKLTITGSGTVDNVTHQKAALVNYGEAVLKGGTFTRSAEASISTKNPGGNSYYVVDNQGTMEIDGAEVVNTGYFSSLLRNMGTAEKSAKLTIKSGTLTQKNFIAVKNDEYGELTITGGTIVSDEQAIQNWTKADITGGTLDGAVITWAYDGFSSETNISGTATINGDVKAVNYDGKTGIPTVRISGGTVNGVLSKGTYEPGKGIIEEAADYESAKIIVSGGTFANAVAEEFCADNFHPNKNADGTYSVHTHSKAAAVKENEKAATCTTSGSYDSVVYCSVCGEEMSRETVTVPAGHSYGTEWKTDGTNHWHECTVCGDKADVSAHTYGDWKVTKEATTEETGLREKTCKVCGHKVTEEIEKLKSSSSKKHHSSSSDSEQTVVVNVQASAVNSAKTGDNAPIMLLCVLCVVALAGIGAVVFYRRKKN